MAMLNNQRVNHEHLGFHHPSDGISPANIDFEPSEIGI